MLTLLLVNFIHAAQVTLTKQTFTTNENITLVFNDMNNGHKDWIAIYSAGADNHGKNVIAWKWTGDTDHGRLTFNKLATGKYKVRAYYNNSYKIEARATFEVKSKNAPRITLTSDSFPTDENITLVFSDMNNGHKDWMAIYRAGTDNNWRNVIDWRWTGDTPEGKMTFGKLKEGNYVVRAYYNNSYKIVAEKDFSVYKKDDVGDETKNALKRAHEACDNGDNSGEDILCSNDLKHAYVLDSTKVSSEYTHYGFYYVTLDTNNVKLIGEETLYDDPMGSVASTFGRPVKKFKGTPIILTRTHSSAYQPDVYYFYTNSIKVKAFNYKDHRRIDEKKIKVLENGKKLYLEQRHPNNKQELWKDTYDISNPMKMVLIHRDIVKI